MPQLSVIIVFLPINKFIPPTSEATMPVKEVRGLFQALTEGGWGGLIGPTAKWKNTQFKQNLLFISLVKVV